MSSGGDGADERFAAAWDDRMHGRATDRPARPGDGTRPFADPTRSTSGTDQELDDDLRVAEMLRGAGRAVPGPDPEASRRMRAAVMGAVTAEVGRTDSTRHLDGTGHDHAGHDRARHDAPTGIGHGRRRADRRGGSRPDDGRPSSAAGASGPGRPRRRGALHRMLSTTAAGMACILALGALTVILSRGALPGETLYGLKRASESAEIGLTSGQQAKARKHLDAAALRLDEVDQLLQRSATTAAGSGPVAAGGDADAALITDNLRAFDEQARTGARMLFAVAARPSGPSAGGLTGWVAEQRTTLDQVAPSLSEAGREQAATSQRLLDQLRLRSEAFENDDATCTGSSTSSDELGPVPCPDTEPAPAPAPARAPTPTSESTEATTSEATSDSSSTSSTTTTTTTSEPTTTSSSQESSASGTAPSTRQAPPPISVPVPVPGLPKVEVPPLLPGLPGLSLG